MLATRCRVDPSGGGVQAHGTIMAALSWRRASTETIGIPACLRNLARSEQAHVVAWQVLQRCHSDVMGRYDREMQMYVGKPCLVDEDCFTTCVKPALRSLQTFTSVSGAAERRRELLGRCAVPTQFRHVFVVKCLHLRAGSELFGLMAMELEVMPWRDDTETKTSAMLQSDPRRRLYLCIGPLFPRGFRTDNETCLAAKGCNWHHEIGTKEECETFALKNDFFCGCSEGFCPQLSRRAGCKTGTVADEDCAQARSLLRAAEVRCLAGAATATQMDVCRREMSNHGFMMRYCLSSRCIPKEKYGFVDDRCIDLYKVNLKACYDQCNVPTGPNPTIKRKTCYKELRPDESADDCFNTPGDPELHWGATEEDLTVSLKMPEELKPRYCSVRIWKQLESIHSVRKRSAEQETLRFRGEAERQRLLDSKLSSEMSARQLQVALAMKPEKIPGCAIGLLKLEISEKQRCKEQSRPGDNCCISPINKTHGICDACIKANTTVCRPGDHVLARWPPNARLYAAKVDEDLGNDFANVLWEDGSVFHTKVPWPHVFSESSGIACTPEAEGCAAHHQCSPLGEYCYSCAGCAKAHGGNPAPYLCAPCPTQRHGACGPLTQCEVLQDSVDSKCPVEKARQICPCKQEWRVRGEYPDAPREDSIKGCFFDVKKGFRWCEVEPPVVAWGEPPSCVAELMVVAERFIYWRRCQPESCVHCQCDCTPTCTAFNVLPVFGRLPVELDQESDDMSQGLPLSSMQKSGFVGPNCSAFSDKRIRGACPFCVACCADYCHLKAQQQEAHEAEAAELALQNAMKDCNATNLSVGCPNGTARFVSALGKARQNIANLRPPFDCTSTNITGCSDMPRGWSDTSGRDCNYYESKYLCTRGGQPGTNWIYDPPRVFKDFAAHGYAANQVCCGCGGGVDCADNPFGWQDPDGNRCGTYRVLGWCNFSGYGANWDPSWGIFPLGTGGVDALAACCACGGGDAQGSVKTRLRYIDNAGSCFEVWPGGRGTFEEPPPWIKEVDELCVFLNGICQHKLNALSYDVGLAKRVPDDPRIYKLCEQKKFITGGVQVLADDEGSTRPGDRRLADLVGQRDRVLRPLERLLQERGSTISVEYFANRGRSMCAYKLPDPFGLYGGPRREDMKPPWLFNKSDVFAPPSIDFTGWPPEFHEALPDGSLQVPSTKLRSLLTQNNVEFVTRSMYHDRVNSWWKLLESLRCHASHEIAFTEYRQDRLWQPTTLGTGRSCMSQRCNVDPTVLNETECSSLQGCSRQCLYCASRGQALHEQGLCYTERSSEVERCEEDLGGVVVDALVFDEKLGVAVQSKVCALLHRPIMYCTRPGENVKRCAHFDTDLCETDPLAKLLGCTLRLRKCQTPHECNIQGRCSDVDVGLSWAMQGTCVITPMDDDQVLRRCDDEGLCYFRIDPPFGMEVRLKHWLLDLLGPDTPDIAGSNPPLEESAQFADEARLRAAGVLTKEECESLPLRPGQRSVWLTKARSSESCLRWQGCCLSRAGEQCELFSGQVVDALAHPDQAANRSELCERCGGQWTPIFSWDTAGGWQRGEMEDSNRDWKPRKWNSVSEWAETIDMDSVRQLYENAVEMRMGKQRVNAVRCILEPLLSALTSVAAACDSGHNTAAMEMAQRSIKEAQENLSFAVTFRDKQNANHDLWMARASEVLAEPGPPIQIMKLGSVLTSAGVDGQMEFGGWAQLSWHRFSAKPARPTEGFTTSSFLDAGAMIYSVAVEPWESFLGMAAPQLALPGRPEDVRARLARFVLAPEEVVTTPPPQLFTKQVSALEGYPPWIINEMIQLGRDPSKEAVDEEEAQRMMIADAARKKEMREKFVAQMGEAADAASGLSLTAQQVLLDPRWPRPGDEVASQKVLAKKPLMPPNVSLDPTMTPLGSFNATCRNVVSNSFGDVIGTLLGDCVTLDASSPLKNSVELCLPFEFDGSEFAATPLARRTGVVLDFAKRETAPASYNVTEPLERPDALGQVPGTLGQVAWDFSSDMRFGRLKPGWSKFTALGLQTVYRRGGSRLCGKVFEAGTSYCPVMRLDVNLYAVVNRKIAVGVELPQIESGCPEVDFVLASAHTKQYLDNSTFTRYQPLEMQVVQPEVLLLAKQREEQALKSSLLQTTAESVKEDNSDDGDADGATNEDQSVTSDDEAPVVAIPGAASCPPGRCLVYGGRGFQVLPKDATEECHLSC
eukprot:TRINITY_DN7343_c0_g1_i1.p1 TRINITY_DN7343_c0_g1~~TRINITY_DN7343_c0_g1_i1.p1  ORF type:complete len:2259 (+),score=322.69 TRINITY_DN7343_c0_g1_i1:195-6779(+)